MFKVAIGKFYWNIISLILVYFLNVLSLYNFVNVVWQIVPTLLTVIDNSYDMPRVQAHAGAALVNFSEICPKNILTLYLDAIMMKLEQVLTAKFKEVCG